MTFIDCYYEAFRFYAWLWDDLDRSNKALDSSLSYEMTLIDSHNESFKF